MARARIFSFGVVYLAIFVFLLLYIFTIRLAENLLDEHFQQLANQAVEITQLDQPIASQIQQSIQANIDESRWVRIGGVRVGTLVLASDGITWIYVQGRIVPQPDGLEPTDVLREAVELLPATATVNATVPHNALLANAILVLYGAILLQGLYLYNRSTTRQHSRQMSLALSSRDEAAHRAAAIESELEQTRQRLAEVEPAEREHSIEIATLQTERHELQRRLSSLAAREEELLGKADRAVELSQEVRALEDLLDEAGGDLESKDAEIRELESNLKRVAKPQSGSGRARGAELMARRLRTLYKTLEIDDRAIDDLVALRDESMKLKAEEKLKRLCDEADNVAVRRKVGGLPEHLSIFELGFAGKGRIYYTKGKQRRFRILSVGAKNSQDSDLDYLRRLGRE
jgi:DNA repair exonuclease SbcCD ATPase subunit